MTSMETNIYHYYGSEADKVPLLSVEYIKTPFLTFARSFKLMNGAFQKTEEGKTFNYNFVEVSLLTKTIIYFLNDQVVHVHPNANPSELVKYEEDQ